MRKKRNDRKRKQVLLADNPIDLLSIIFSVVALLVLLSLSFNYYNSTEYPTVASDCLILLVEGLFGLGGIFATRILLCSKRGQNEDLIANQFNPDKTPFNIVLATAFYFLIQIVVILLRESKIFQVAAVDVFAFYLSAAIVEELFFRGFLVMLVQGLLVKFFNIKPRKEEDLIVINLFCSILSGAIFALVHTSYWTDPFLMVLTFAGGISQSIFYIKTKNLSVPMLSHAAINLTASGSLLQSI